MERGRGRGPVPVPVLPPRMVRVRVGAQLVVVLVGARIFPVGMSLRSVAVVGMVAGVFLDRDQRRQVMPVGQHELEVERAQQEGGTPGAGETGE